MQYVIKLKFTKKEATKGIVVSFIRKKHTNYRFNMKNGVIENPFNYLPQK